MVSQADSLFILAEPPEGVQRKPKKSKRSARGTKIRVRVHAKGKRKMKEYKSKEIISSDESDRPLALTLKKRAVKVRPRPTEKNVPLLDNEPTRDPSPKDSTNAEEAVS